jgi:hypothetical protein
MPHSSADPPSAPFSPSVESEAPSARRPEGTPENTAGATDPQQPAPQDGEPRRRRRRRRRRPPPAITSGEPAAGDQGQTEESSSPGGATQTGMPTAPSGDSRPQMPRRRRRRHRRPPPEPAAGLDIPAPEPGPGGETVQGTQGLEPMLSQPAPSGPPSTDRSRQHPGRRPRHRRPPRDGGAPDARRDSGSPSEAATVSDARAETGAANFSRSGADARRERYPRSTGPQERAGREAGRRDRGIGGRGSRGNRAAGRRQGADRGASQTKPPQKLYALESVVDRGFEDVTDPSDESITHRVHWTIVKRSVADQRSGKAMSSAYVLQREGTDSEFPNLGAARAAVNKTIVHPERLTLSKAEHAAAKK